MNPGNVTDEFTYMPYGYAKHIAHPGSSETPFQWLGGYGVYYDSVTDLHLTLHRAYSSKIKRFIHPDPLGIDGGVNVYAMANLNPLAFVDPLGLDAIFLVDSTAVFGQGHAASAVGSDATFWTYYSFGFGKSIGTHDNHDVKNYNTLKELQADNSRYDKQIRYPATSDQDLAARREGNSRFGDTYNLCAQNCDDIASDIIRAGGHEFDDAWRPMESYRKNLPDDGEPTGDQNSKSINPMK